jgi:hypothetical protein
MCIKINKIGKQEVGIRWVQRRFPRYGVPIWSLWPNTRFLPSIACLPTLLIFLHIEHAFVYAHFLLHFSLQLLMTGIWYLVTSFIYVCHIVGSVFGPVRFLLPVSLNKMNCVLMLTYDTPALWQTGSRNLTGQKTLPTIWGTYMRGKRFWIHQIPTSCLPILLIFIHI